MPIHRCPQVGELLAPLVSDPDVSIEVASFAAVALGLVFVGTCHAASVEAILQARRRPLESLKIPNLSSTAAAPCRL
jgi:26S proteasome regulatory subunit N1